MSKFAISNLRQNFYARNERKQCALSISSGLVWSGWPEFSHFPAERLQTKTEFINQKCMIAEAPRFPSPTLVCGFCGCCGDVLATATTKRQKTR